MKRTFSLTSITLALFALTLGGACDDTSSVGSGNGNTGGSSGATTPSTSGAMMGTGGTGGIGGTGDTGGIGGLDSSGSSGGGAPGTAVPASKLDILVEVDNSRSMADKQEVLSVALSNLVQSISNPPCLDAGGALVSQPSSGLDMCPSGSKRAFVPIRDIHMGIISSSLGSHGADTCLPTEPVGKSCPDASQANTTNDDKGHLLTRSGTCGGTQATTYNNQGFLAWDPEAKASPPGDTDIVSFNAKIKTLLLGAGQIGCGFESQLESWYRFLVDPNPYSSITVDPQTQSAVPSGTDTALLSQRAAFLRPDSLVAIIMLTDEDDCSIKDGGINFYTAQQRQPGNTSPFHFPRARQECETNPNDVCCRSCIADQDGCPVDPNCSDPTKMFLTNEEDPMNLRCFDQKRRFGYDFLEPIDRYRAGLQDAKIADRDGNLVQNPLFAGGRDPSLVMLTGIVGVPWQLLARDSTDLRKGYKSADELNTAGSDGNTTWRKIIGDPAKNQAPKDPHMVPSRSPRPGLPAPSSAPGADPYNGHEYTTDAKAGDLEYACIFPLNTPRECNGTSDSCDCYPGITDNPLCDPKAPTKQVNAKAYPGLRELGVLKSLGSQGVTASVCPSQVVDTTRSDFAYRPALRALLERIRPHLSPSSK